MDELQQKRKRYYSQIAEKFGDMMRADLALRQKYTKKSPCKIVSLANTFNLMVSPILGAKRNVGNIHRFYTSANWQKDKMKQVLNFKQKLKHSLDKSRIKKQQRNQYLTNIVRFKKNNSIADRQLKLEEVQNKKKNQVKSIKKILSQSSQCVTKDKRLTQLQYALRCLQRRSKNKYNKIQ